MRFTSRIWWTGGLLSLAAGVCWLIASLFPDRVFSVYLEVRRWVTAAGPVQTLPIPVASGGDAVRSFHEDAAASSLPMPALTEQGEKMRPTTVSTMFRLPFCDNKSLTVELPSRYQVVHWQRGDFDLFSISDAGQSSGTELMLYIGHAPNERHPDGANRSKGSVAGRLVDWYSWSEQVKGKTVYLSEAVLDLYPIEVKRPTLVLGKPPAPPPAPPPPPPKVRCEEGISVHLLAKGASREAVTSAAALAASLKR